MNRQGKLLDSRILEPTSMPQADIRMKPLVVAAIDQADRLLAPLTLAAVGDGSCLIIPMFHGIYPDRSSASSRSYDPQQGLTLEDFRRVVASFHRAEYRFVTPEEIVAGLPGGGKYAMLTFDDGYFNNLSVLPVLHEFKAPAVFFISATHVQSGKAFWWDVLYREMMGSSRSSQEVEAARARLKLLRTDEVEARLKAEFQLDDLRPAGDMDRPMTPAELKELSRDRYAIIGNHTLDHAILTNYSETEVHEQIAGAQQALCEIAGVVPTCIAYPNGNCSPGIIEAAKQAGLTSGVSTAYGRNSVPHSRGEEQCMALKRVVPIGFRDIESQCRVFRSPFSLRNAGAMLRRRLQAAAY